MEPTKYLVYFVVVATVLIGSALGNEEGGEIGTSGGENGECRLETGRQTKMKVLDELGRVISRCVEKSNISDSIIGFVNNLEESRSVANHFCERLPTLKKCISEVSRNWAGCYNETLNKLYSVFVDLIDITSNKVCLNDGESLAIIMDGSKRHAAHSTSMNDVVRECVIFGGRRWVLAQRSNAEISTKILITHREMKMFMVCLNEYIHGDEAFLSVAEEVMNETTDKMKCIHPSDGNLVLCNTIDDSLIDRESVCPLKTGNTSFPVSLFLEGRTTICFIQKEPYTPKLSDATTIEEFQEYFRNYCRRQNRVQNCFNETAQAAGLCLHDTQYKKYNLVRDYLNNVFKAACFEEGRRVATLFYTAKALKNSTDDKDALLKCLTNLQSARSQLDYDEQTRIYQYYQELPRARKCLIDNIAGDSTFVEDVNSFINEIMIKMKCINPEDGSTVLCKTLDSN